MLGTLNTIELKAFVPARDFELSKHVPPEQRPWKMRDFVLIDPSGVLWRIAENTP